MIYWLHLMALHLQCDTVQPSLALHPHRLTYSSHHVSVALDLVMSSALLLIGNICI